ncbi:MAG: hypothetical protein WA776_20340 [Xanthobacteraceae bacterium]
MHDATTSAILLIWTTVLFAPPIMFLAFHGIRRLWPFAQAPVISAVAAILCFALGLAALRLSFTNAWANIALASVTYFAYCFLAASCWQISRKTLRFIAAFLTIIPIGLGYIVGTVGVLGLAWIVGDYASPPEHVESMGAQLVCEINGWGSVLDGVYHVQLYRRYSAFPFVERKVAELTVDYNTGDADKTCSDALNARAHG